MIKTFFIKIAGSFLIIAVIYTGSFVLMEETLEKTERAEGEREAIFYQFNTSKSTTNPQKHQPQNKNITPLPKQKIGVDNTLSESLDFNINFIYFTSYLRDSYLI